MANATISILTGSTITNKGVNDILVTGLSSGVNYRLMANGKDTGLTAVANSSGKIAFDIVYPNSPYTYSKVEGPTLFGQAEPLTQTIIYDNTSGGGGKATSFSVQPANDPVAELPRPTPVVAPDFNTFNELVFAAYPETGGTLQKPIAYVSDTTVNEGRTAFWTIAAGYYNTDSGTTAGPSYTFYYTIEGKISASDFEDNTLSGKITTTNQSYNGKLKGNIQVNRVGYLSKKLKSDRLSEGAESIILKLRTGNSSGPVVATAPTITVVDTSVAPVYNITPNKFAVNEGETVNWTITSNASDLNQKLYYTNSGTTVAADFTDELNSGEIPTITNYIPNGLSSVPRISDRTASGNSVWIGQTFEMSKLGGVITAGGLLESSSAPFPQLQKLRVGTVTGEVWTTVATASRGLLDENRNGSRGAVSDLGVPAGQYKIFKYPTEGKLVSAADFAGITGAKNYKDQFVARTDQYGTWDTTTQWLQASGLKPLTKYDIYENTTKVGAITSTELGSITIAFLTSAYASRGNGVVGTLPVGEGPQALPIPLGTSTAGKITYSFKEPSAAVIDWAFDYDAEPDTVNNRYRIVGGGATGATGASSVSATAKNLYSVLTTGAREVSRDEYGSVGATLSKTIKLDKYTENPETIIINVRTGSTTGPIIANSEPVTVTSTSNNEYMISPDKFTVNEDDFITWNVTYTGPTQTLYYSANTTMANSISSSDFTDGILSGTITADGSGRGVISKRIKLDSESEDDEKIIMYVRTGNTTGPIVANSPLVIVKNVPIEFYINANKDEVQEGESVTWTVSYTGPTQTLYYSANTTISGAITAADFSDNDTDGTITADGTNGGKIQKTIKYDANVENDEKIIMYVRTGNTTGPIVAAADLVTVKNKPVVYSIAPNKTQITEGESVTWTVNYTGVTDTLYYSANTTMANAISSSDFTDSTVTGTITADGSNGGRITKEIKYDADIEDDEKIVMYVRVGSAAGNIVATSDVVTVKNKPITYTITPSVTEVDEGESVTWSISYSGPTQTLYYTANTTMANAVNSSDFTDGNANGTITAVGTNGGTITKAVKLDADIEDNEKILMYVRTGSTTGPIVANSEIVVVNEKTPVYTIAPNKTTISEGEKVTWTITYTGATQTLYYTANTSIANAVSSADFSDSNANGTVTAVGTNGGKIEKTLIDSDGTSEGDEYIVMHLRTGSTTGPIVANSVMVTVNDTVIPPSTETYDITVTPLTYDEGATITWNVTTTNVSNGTSLYYTANTTMANAISSSDFSGGNANGSLTIQNNLGSFSKTLLSEGTSEDIESIIMYLRTGSETGPIVATAPIVKVNDTTPTYSASVNPITALEGDTITWTITTTNVANGVTLYYTANTTTANAISSSDFSEGNANGSFTIQNNTATFTRQLATTGTNEGDEFIKMHIRTASEAGPIVHTAPTVTAKDTTPTYDTNVSSTVVNEGSTITWTVTTTNVANGTSLYYTANTTMANAISSADFSEGDANGSFTIQNNTATFSRVLASTQTNEGDEFIKMHIRTASETGPIVDTAPIVTAKDTTPTYDITVSPTVIDEGGTVTWNITTTNVSNGSFLYYTANTSIANAINSADFTDGSANGSIEIRNNTGVFRKTLYTDRTSEGYEYIKMHLRTGSATGPIVDTAPIVTVNDTSATESYSITTNQTTVNEGETIEWTVITNNVANGTLLYYTANTNITLNSIQSSDFLDENANGYIIISGDGIVTSTIFAKTLKNDLSLEGPEYIVMCLRKDAEDGSIVAVAPTIKVEDTSYPIIRYNISANAQSVVEGNSVSWTISTTNFGNGTLYYTNSGNTVAADFIDNLNSGAVVVTNDSGSFTKTLVDDAASEGTQSIIMQLRVGSTSGNVVATSGAVTVYDYVEPEIPVTYSIIPNTISASEGDTIVWNVTTTNVANGTTLYHTLSNQSTTVAADFTTNPNGSIIIQNNAGSFIRTIANDLLVEGNETIIMQLRTGSANGTVVATSPTIVILDTTIPPEPAPKFFANIVPIVPTEPPVLPQPTVTETIVDVSISSNTRDLGVIKSTTIYGNGNQTPLSGVSLYFDYVQTFFIDPKTVDNAQNVSLSDIELFFSRKPHPTQNQSQIENPGVYVYICQVKDGVPDLSKVFVQSKIRNEYDQIFPSVDAQTPTLFQFARPITLKTGEYYGIVINFEDPQFSLWEATQGQLILGSRQTCASTYTNGKLFRASNYLEIDRNPNTLDEVLKAVTDSDLKFNVNILEFDTTSAIIELTNSDYEFLKINVHSFVTESQYSFGNGEKVYQDFGNNAANVTFYKAGTITIVNNSLPPRTLGTEYLGVDTNFTSDCTVGDSIVITDGSLANTFIRKVVQITNSTSISLDRPVEFPGTNSTIPGGSSIPVNAKYKLTAVGKFEDFKSNTVILNDSNADSRIRFINDGINYITFTPGQGYANTDYIVFSGLNSTLNGRATITTSTTGNIVGINIVNTGYGFSIANGVSPTVTVYKSDGSLGNTSATITATIGSQLKGEVTRSKVDVVEVLGIPVNSIIPDIHVDVKNGSVSDFNINFAFDSASSFVFRDQTYTKFAMEPLNIEAYNATLLSKSLEVLNRNTLAPSTSEGKSSIIKFVIQSTNKYESPDLESQLSKLFVYTNIINNDFSGENTNSGKALSRHISKKINFAKDRFAEDIRVFAKMWKPTGTDVKIYARIHNSKDTEAFDDKDWSELELKETGANGKLFSDIRKKDDFIEFQYGFRSYPIIDHDLAGTASINELQSLTAVIGLGTQFNRELSNGDVIVLYDPLDANTTYTVAVVANTPTPTAFEIHTPVTNNSILGATLKIGKVSQPHMAFNNIQNDNVVRYYSTSLTEFDGYDTLAIKIVPLSTSSYVVPAIDDIRVIGVSA